MGKRGPVKEKNEVMPCRRCGVCCTSHQAFVTTPDIERIIACLGITLADWDRLYDDTRWQYSEYRLIRHTGGACAFLRFENGLATCDIHAVKPACCAAWQPGPDRPECRDGMGVKKGRIRRHPSGIKT
jgi:Fe-S-cluster containining protein